jgi:manganese-transporting P-type ATPase
MYSPPPPLIENTNLVSCRASPDKLVSSSLITRITLHNPLPRWAHAYILPFIPFYPLFGTIYFFKYDEYIGSEEWTFVYFGSLITLNALCWLCVHWSVTLEALFTATKVFTQDIKVLICRRNRLETQV